MPSLYELTNDIADEDYDLLKKLKFARKDWHLTSKDEKSNYVIMEIYQDYLPSFIYFKNNKQTPLDYTQYLENDWYIIKKG